MFSQLHGELLARIKARYDRRGRSDLWTDVTRAEFMYVFSLIPEEHLTAVVDELLLNPSTDNHGRPLNWLPDPADIVLIARKMTGQAQESASAVVEEIMHKIASVGLYGAVHPERPTIRLEGAPTLSDAAAAVVEAMGGWRSLCMEETPTGVLRGQLLRIAQDVVQQSKSMPVFAKVSGRNGHGLRQLTGEMTLMVEGEEQRDDS